MSEGLWGYLSKLIPWKDIKEDWLTFDSTVLERYGKQEGAKKGYNPKKKGRGSHSPLLAFLNRRQQAMGKELSLFEDNFEMKDYRFSVWITNSKDMAYEVWKQCRPSANDENTIKELKEDFALGGFSMNGSTFNKCSIKRYVPYGFDNCNAVG